MHVAVCLSICVVFLINLIVFSEATRVIYCNDIKLPWRRAMTACTDAGGTPVGKNIFGASQFQMKNQTFWTSDLITRTYFTIGAANLHTGDLCGYTDFDGSNPYSNEMFANCSFQYNYICCPEGTASYPVITDCIQSGTRETATSCNQTYSGLVLSSNKIIGKFWTNTAVRITQNEIPAVNNWNYYGQNTYHCGTINRDGIFQYTETCNQLLLSYCSFDNYEEKSHFMRVCSSPIFSSEKTSTKMQMSYMTTSSTSPKIQSSKTPKWTTSQSTWTKNNFDRTSVTITQSILASRKTSTKRQNLDTKIPNSNDNLSVQTTDVSRQYRQYEAKIYDSKMVIGASVGVGVPVVLGIFLIGLIFLRRRGLIRRPSTKETDAHANAAYGVTNGDVLFSTPALSTNENSHQHRDNERGRTDNVYSGVNKQHPEIKGIGPKAPYGKGKMRVRTARDTKRTAKETTAQEYDSTCFKDSAKLGQRNDYDHHDKGTDEYNTTCLGNIPLHHDNEYNTLGESGVYNVASLRGNKAPNAVSTIANNGIYNTLSNQEDDYNTVNLHRDNAPHAALRSDDTYNTFRNNTDDYNVVVLNGETNPNLMINHDDIYNTLGRGTEEYNTVDFHRKTEANKSEDCYDRLH